MKRIRSSGARVEVVFSSGVISMVSENWPHHSVPVLLVALTEWSQLCGNHLAGTGEDSEEME